MDQVGPSPAWVLRESDAITHEVIWRGRDWIVGFGWNGLNELTQSTSPQGAVDYTYDALGRRTSMTAGSQATVDYAWDAANRLTGITQGAASVGFSYDAANRRSTLTLPNGVTMTTSYDAANEVTGIAYAQGNGTSIGSLAYAYDAAGRRISQGGTLASDALPTATTAASTFDADNRQTGHSGTALQYDADGNLVSDGTDTYVWNARNQLAQIKQGGSVIDSFSYDALGRRQSKSIDGAATSFLYDGVNPVQETQGTTVSPILTGLGIDQRFARRGPSGEAYFLTDAQGSTIGLTDASGNLIQQYHYGPYGESNANNPGITNPYQYTGRENDSDGLYYYRARYYSPELKRFISEDPAGFAGGQDNFFAYAGGNPVDYSDPSGHLFVEAIVGAAVGGTRGAIEGSLENDSGAKFRNDVLEGVFAGGLAGLTDDPELLGMLPGIGLRAGISSLGEAAREEANYGCLNGGDVLAAGILSAGGDMVGTGFEDAVRGDGGSFGYGMRALKTGASDSLVGSAQTFINELEAIGEPPTVDGLRPYVAHQ